jgi:hypothetical protein
VLDSAKPITIVNGHGHDGIRLFKELAEFSRKTKARRAFKFGYVLWRCRRLKSRPFFPIAARTRDCK